jgi:hypothetical protein
MNQNESNYQVESAVESGWLEEFRCDVCNLEYLLNPTQSYCPKCGMMIREHKPIWKLCSACKQWFHPSRFTIGKNVCKPCVSTKTKRAQLRGKMPVQSKIRA